ncbi:GFA family protein [Erythrobacter insulae]|uniref:GFA family protein n=1 Tax=Erythrobacter insulae TaxID=2584124 RepID=A0A547PE77_9SPHN|nr:GFA family protein [Erythrobacter insulae]TRD12428.1 GFA family protein [Erythrobacter insulae]
MAHGAKRSGQEVKGELSGQCLCGAVRYTLREGFRLKPYACHCGNCQSRTGSAFSEHMLFAISDMNISGELDAGEYDMPSGGHSTIYGCAKCKARIYAVNANREGMASLRCGTLDNSTDLDIQHHIWVASKQPWIGLHEGAKTMEQQPRSHQEWVEFVGIA